MVFYFSTQREEMSFAFSVYFVCKIENRTDAYATEPKH